MNVDYNSLDSLKEKVNSITNSVNNKLSSISVDNNNIFKKINFISFNSFIYGFIVIVTAILLGFSKPMIILSKDNNNNYYVNGFKFLFTLIIVSFILIMFVRSIITKKFI